MKDLIEANQAKFPPIYDTDFLQNHILSIEELIEWTDVGILVDENCNSILILLLQDHNVTSILRICLATDKNLIAIQLLKRDEGKIFFGGLQGHELNLDEIHSIKRINEVWNSIPDQIAEFTPDDVNAFFSKIESESKKSGRGQNFSTQTKRKIMQDSHGRCMFEGCGEDLGLDKLTGTEGNFSYLAHNVASSEKGPRGIVGLSEKLSDSSNNVLLLCDKHHRLIDKIATPDYPASRLSEMRREFIKTADKLLDGLSYQPIPAFSVLWPVHRQVISGPSSTQVSQSLSTLKSRLHGIVNEVSDNESVLRESDPEIIREIMIHCINTTADKIQMQAHNSRYRVALYAFGLMPELIALGAKLGNKNEITPIPRFRDSNQWVWPSEEPTGPFYTISGIEYLSDNEKDIILILALTNEPESMRNAVEEIKKNTNRKVVSIKSLPDRMGNGALAHPEDGYGFMKDIQRLFHYLRSKHRVSKIHLLPCASNAACIFFGQAFDSHHPDIVIYDFKGNSMEKSLIISNKDNKCTVNLAS